MNTEGMFPCYSPPFKRFLEKEKNILYIDKKKNELVDKICWYFIRSEEFNEALMEWRNRKIQNNKFFQQDTK